MGNYNNSNKRHGFRIFLLVMLGYLFIFIIMPKDGSSAPAASPTSAPSASPTSAPSASPTSAPAAARATIPETTVYDRDGITVRISGLDGDGKFRFTVGNGSDADIMFMLESVAANGCRIYDLDSDSYSKYVTPGNRASGTFSLAGYGAYGTGDPVMTIDIRAYVAVCDGSGTDSYFRATIRTSLYDEETAATIPAVDGYVSYEDENIRIIVTRTSDSLSDFDYYLENRTSGRVVAEFSYMSVNGEMCETSPLRWLEAFPYGSDYTRAVDRSGFFSLYSALDNEVAEKGFDNVEKIGCTLNVILKDDATDNTTDRYEVSGLTLYQKE